MPPETVASVQGAAATSSSTPASDSQIQNAVLERSKQLIVLYPNARGAKEAT